MKKTYIIAEMAWSHTGKLDIAIDILKAVKESKADAISIHLTNMPTYMTKDYKCVAGTTLSSSASDETTIYNYLETINLTKDEWKIFNNEVKKNNIDLLVMCNDVESFEFSLELDVASYVIPASNFLEFEYIKKIVNTNDNIIIRSGGATLDEVKNILDYIYNIKNTAKICLLAGIQLYPTPIEQLHIASLKTLSQKFINKDLTYGLADHIDGDNQFAKYLPVLAIPFGATVLEKHITRHRSEKLEDFEAALGTEDFKVFVEFIRSAEKAIGSGELNYMHNNDSYKKYRDVHRKKIVAKFDLKKGTVLNGDNTTFKRSDSGLQLEFLNKIYGKKIIKDVKKDQGIEFDIINSNE